MDYKAGGLPGQRGLGRSLFAKTHGALVAGQPVFITMDSAGYITEAIPAVGGIGLVGVPIHALASGDVGEFVVEGVAYIYDGDAGGATSGHGIQVSNASGYGKDSTAGFSGNVGDYAITDCAVAQETTTAAGLVKCYLHGQLCTSVA